MAYVIKWSFIVTRWVYWIEQYSHAANLVAFRCLMNGGVNQDMGIGALALKSIPFVGMACTTRYAPCVNTAAS